MSKNNLYTLVIDDKLDGKFREMKKRFQDGEKIIDTAVHGNKMLVTTEVSQNKEKNLLLEDLRAGKLSEFGEKRS